MQNSIGVYEIVGDRGLCLSPSENAVMSFHLSLITNPNANWSMVLVVFMVARKCKYSLSRTEAYYADSRYKINKYVSSDTVKARLV